MDKIKDEMLNVIVFGLKHEYQEKAIFSLILDGKTYKTSDNFIKSIYGYNDQLKMNIYFYILNEVNFQMKNLDSFIEKNDLNFNLIMFFPNYEDYIKGNNLNDLKNLENFQKNYFNFNITDMIISVFCNQEGSILEENKKLLSNNLFNKLRMKDFLIFKANICFYDSTNSNEKFRKPFENFVSRMEKVFFNKKFSQLPQKTYVKKSSNPNQKNVHIKCILLGFVATGKTVLERNLSTDEKILRPPCTVNIKETNVEFIYQDINYKITLLDTQGCNLNNKEDLKIALKYCFTKCNVILLIYDFEHLINSLSKKTVINNSLEHLEEFYIDLIKNSTFDSTKGKVCLLTNKIDKKKDIKVEFNGKEYDYLDNINKAETLKDYLNEKINRYTDILGLNCSIRNYFTSGHIYQDDLKFILMNFLGNPELLKESPVDEDNQKNKEQGKDNENKKLYFNNNNLSSKKNNVCIFLGFLFIVFLILVGQLLKKKKK